MFTFLKQYKKPLETSAEADLDFSGCFGRKNYDTSLSFSTNP